MPRFGLHDVAVLETAALVTLTVLAHVLLALRLAELNEAEFDADAVAVLDVDTDDGNVGDGARPLEDHLE